MLPVTNHYSHLPTISINERFTVDVVNDVVGNLQRVDKFVDNDAIHNRHGFQATLEPSIWT